ncbi:putative secreted beta-glucosidase adg3 [Smittium culicis]|uniref:Putative secreted beta-glucosidase adg3 n=1 Tax=Smittium culicis TaxID=133412 RepID=A0A1R1YNE3_9FUNG|nr:putative secreted beta-glucosidase adg3 [Smittium culicis]
MTEAKAPSGSLSNKIFVKGQKDISQTIHKSSDGKNVSKKIKRLDSKIPSPQPKLSNKNINNKASIRIKRSSRYINYAKRQDGNSNENVKFQYQDSVKPPIDNDAQLPDGVSNSGSDDSKIAVDRYQEGTDHANQSRGDANSGRGNSRGNSSDSKYQESYLGNEKERENSSSKIPSADNSSGNRDTKYKDNSNQNGRPGSSSANNSGDSKESNRNTDRITNYQESSQPDESTGNASNQEKDENKKPISGNSPSNSGDGKGGSSTENSGKPGNSSGSEIAEKAPTEPDSNGDSAPSGLCKFPWAQGNNENVYPITPEEMNAGWAMSPDQECKKGTWCPYACSPGYYSAQWDPSATLYNGAGSMNGGLYCDNNGVLQKPFPDLPYCKQGVFNAIIRNTLSQPVSACQTVYPGNEAMIIPSVAQPGSTVPLNVVPNTYWLGTSSQFYVNLAGSTEKQCIWGNPDKPVGNWGPYIFGAGQASDGNTYISVQYNPLYSEVGFKTSDTYNVEIKCLSGFCNFPEPKVCKCEKGICSVENGCTVTLVGDAKAEFVIY